MKFNSNFCQPIYDGRSIAYAPVVLPPNPHEPTEAEYNAAGWFRNAVQPPAPPEGKVVSSTLYVVRGNAVVAQYEYCDAPARVRTFSKLKLYAALAQAGLWPALEAWLKTQTVNGINAYEAFTMAQDLSDAHPLFNDWYAAAKAALNIDDATAESILTAAEITP